MFTGRDALFSVEQAIGQIRSDESDLDASLRSAMDDAARLRSEESQAFRTLARVKLGDLMREKVISHIDAAEQRALAIIENHRKALEELSRKRDDAQQRLTQAEAKKHKCDQDLAQVLDELDRFRHNIAGRIKDDPDWHAAEAAAEEAKKIAANADQKASLSEADLAQKRKPYQDDPLFMYLWNKKFGQAEDRSFYFVRYFDRMVAGLMDYPGARANYAMLLEIPMRLREHANAKEKDAAACQDGVTVLERKALVAAGIEPIEVRAEAGAAAVKAAADDVVKMTSELAGIEAERQKEAGTSEDAAYSKAVEMLAQALAQEDLGRLYQDAVQTATKEDDAAVISIGQTREALGKADAELSQIRTQIREMARRRVELEGSRDRARHSGFDNPMGNYGSAQDAIGVVIGGILRGALNGGDLDRVLRDNYRFPVPRSDPDFGGWSRKASFPAPWEHSGTRNGSGWSTGGSF
jgi:hypothetical protein